MSKVGQDKAEGDSGKANGALSNPDGVNSSLATEKEVKLHRKVGLVSGVSFIVGSIIGSGIFISPKGVLRGSGSVGLALISWTLCGIVSLGGALGYAELGSVIPESGGEVAYLGYSFGDMFSFLFSWMTMVMARPTGLSAVTLTCAEYVMVPIFDDGCGGPPEEIKKVFAIMLIVLLLAINCYSVNLASGIQVIFTSAKVFALIIIIFGGFVRLGQGHTEHLETGFEGTVNNPGSIALGLYSGMFAYEGWNVLNFITEELVNPERNLWLAICIALPFIIVVYILANISYFTVMSVDGLLDSSAVATTWADAVIPDVWWLIPIFVAMSTFGAGNGSLFTASRVMFASARKSHFPEALSMVNTDFHTPIPSLTMLSFIAVIYTLIGNVGSLVDYMSFAIWIFYGLVMAALFFFRWKLPDAKRSFKVPLIIPGFVLCAAVFLVVAPIVSDPQMELLYATLMILAGLILYFPFVYFKFRLPGMDKFTMFTQLSLKVISSESSDLDMAKAKVADTIEMTAL